MRKTLILIALIFTAGLLKATPGKGGYMGHRFIVGVEGAYSPFYTSASDFFTKYNFQYGGNIGIIVSRRSQLNLNYSMWSLGNNQAFNRDESNPTYYKGDRIKGMEFGLTLRNFRKNRGGIAPIGKFYDLGLSYTTNEFVAGNDNSIYNSGVNSKSSLGQVIFHAGVGAQMVFWDRVVANTGIRAGGPLLNIGSTGSIGFLTRRSFEKEIFQVFFGVGVLL
jgi:hypothetical protein